MVAGRKLTIGAGNADGLTIFDFQNVGYATDESEGPILGPPAGQGDAKQGRG
jgi:hypothetical protein